MKDANKILKIILCIVIIIPGMMVTYWLSRSAANKHIYNPKYMDMITNLVASPYKNQETLEELVDNQNLFDAYIGEDVCITYATVQEFINDDPIRGSDYVCVTVRTADSPWSWGHKRSIIDSTIYLFMDSSPLLTKLKEGDVIIFHGVLDKTASSTIKLAYGELLYVFEGGVL